MHNRNHVFFIAAALAVAGLALFLYKVTSLGMPLSPDQESEVWTVEARISMVGGAGPVKAALLIPRSPAGFGILNENFVSRGFGLNTRDVDNNRVAEWARRRAKGPQALYYRVALYRDESNVDARPEIDFPTVPQLEEPFATALTQLVSDARARSADIASFSAQVLRTLNSSTPSENVALFIGEGTGSLDKARVAKTILAGARIPSMIAHGIELRGEPHLASTAPWLEVFNGERWLYFNPSTGDEFAPGSRLTWFYGDGPLVKVDGARRVETELFVRRELVDSLAIAERRAEAHGSHAIEFSLFELPLRTQAVYAVLLMIPIGALVMVVMRNLVGVPTFGTFTPILIALAFRETRLLYGIILFSLVVALGLAVRFYLDRLRLLLVPRLASILTVVVIMLLVISVLSQRLDLETGLSVALFPMVILTMVIERMSIVWDERGSTAALKEGIGSLVVAIGAYLVMSIDQLEHLLFVFPELLLVVLAVALLLGRYTGYRLTELARFAVLGGPTNKTADDSEVMKYAWPSVLRAAGVVGINQRNGDYIMRYNPRRLYPLVDNKLVTKDLLLKADMAVPELYAVIETQHDVGRMHEIVAGYESFVMKPAHGSGGDGIMVVDGVNKKGYRRHDGRVLSFDEARHHASTTLSGQYSLAGIPDAMMVEYRVRFDPFFEHVAYQGIPDIRVIVFLGYPVMSMVRLPTRMSDGKANLHQGAIGVGIDLATGITGSGSWGNDAVTEHPDTGHPIAGLTIPSWETILSLAARCHDITGLGYLGVDIVLDRDRGPLILELNARPGLNIQISNGAGLGKRLRQVEALGERAGDSAARVAYAREHFAHAAAVALA